MVAQDNHQPLVKSDSPYLKMQTVKGECLQFQFLHSYITVIIKPGKYVNSPTNCQPIALLNSIHKILPKSNRLSKILRLIHKDQVGFVLARRVGGNTRCTVNLVDVVMKSKEPALLLSLDAQKTFNRLSWPYMFALLQHLGFWGHLIKALFALYLSPYGKLNYLLPPHIMG